MCEVCINPRVSGELSFEEKKGNERKIMKRKGESQIDAGENRKK